MFYYFNGTFPFTKGLLPVSDGETLEGSEKVSMKTLHELFKDTKSHGLVSLHFLLALKLFFRGDIQISKDVRTELYKNLLKSFKTLPREQQIEFEKISNLSAHINFKTKLLLNHTIKS